MQAFLITRLNGHRCIFVTAAQKTGFNITNTQANYKPVIENFAKSLPENIQVIQNFDQADNVNKRIEGLGIDFLIAILLVSITLLPLGIRAASVVMISIPLSLLIGVTLLHYLGFNLNQLSIVGFVVALGLLVEDSIVVVENIERWMRDGYTRLETTIQGTKQIGVAVIGCTATLMIAFFPLILMPEASGDFIRSLPMAVVTTVFASLIVAFTVIPFFCNILLHKKYAKDNEGKLLFRFLKNSINKVYAPVLDKSLRKPIISIGIAVLLFIGSLMLIPIVGFSLFPPSEKPQFLINVVTPLQSNLTHTNKIALDIENVLHEMPDIKYFSTNVGKGNPMIYYNQMQENERTDYAQIFVQLDENTSSTKKMEVIDALRIKFKKFDGVKIEVKNFEQGPSILAPVEVKLYGENLDTLSVLADRVQTMLKNTEGTMYIDNPLSNKKTDLRVKINKEKAQMYGIMSSDIYRNIRMVVAGLNMGNISTDNDDDFELIITAPKGEQATLDIFDNLHINNYQGKSIPIKQIATLELESSPVSIRHQNKTRMTSVSAFVQKGFLNVQVNNVVVKKMEQLKLPQGYNYKMGGELESREESFGGFGTVIIITIFLFLAILILEFKTFKSTLIVLSVIPLGIIGALVALALTNNSMSFVANIGLIALAGIEVKNSILLVDFTNQLRAEGKSLEFAIREAGEIRFLPIVLTTLTAIFGLLPIAISSNPLISPLAIVIIGGLISSTILSRIVTPVLYKLLPPQVQVLNIETDQAKKIEG
ncbi:MAG: efflux RND transporter permease subunit [Breznakibacter sp.]|nr:efflux RND transporter permease subunit [Breznakibacter sp.]